MSPPRDTKSGDESPHSKNAMFAPHRKADGLYIQIQIMFLRLMSPIGSRLVNGSP